MSSYSTLFYVCFGLFNVLRFTQKITPISEKINLKSCMTGLSVFKGTLHFQSFVGLFLE